MKHLKYTPQHKMSYCTRLSTLVFTISTIPILIASEYIPLGAVFDQTDRRALEESAAFHHAINQFSRHQSRLKLVPEVSKTTINDSYAVATTICKLMVNGMFAYFLPHSSDTLDIVRSYSNTFHVPFVSSGTAVNDTGQDIGFEIYVSPLYANAIVDIMKHYNWQTIWYIYDCDEGLERLQQLLEAMHETGYFAEVKIFRVSGVEDAFNTLQRIDSRRDDGKKILLDMSNDLCQEILERQKKDSRGMLHHYFIVSLGMSEMTIDVLNHGGLNITGFRLVDPTNSTVRNFIPAWSKLDSKIYPGAGTGNISVHAALAVDAVTVLFRALAGMIGSNPNIFKNSIRNGKVINNGTEGIDCDGVPVQTWKHGRDIVKFMKNVDFNGLTGPIKFDKFGLRKDYRLDILEVHLSRQMAKIGTWHSDLPIGSRIHIHAVQIIRPKGNNTIANRTRIITSVLTEPYLIKREYLPDGTIATGNDAYVGYCADLAGKIAELVGFDYKLVPVKDGRFGVLDANNTWNGMVGELVRHEADIAIAPLTITADREEVIDFSKPFMSLGISIMIRRPIEDIPGVFSFMNPLSYEIWMCVIFAYIGVSVVLFLVSRFSPFEWHIEDNTDGPTITNNFTIFNSLWFSLGAFMQQGCDIEPRSISGRIVGSVWWFFTLIIISSYTANLAAFLTVERMQSPIESAEDLSKQTEIKYGTLDAGSTKEFFKASTIPVYERMWAFMSTADPSLGLFVSTNEEGVQKVKEGKYAFLIESTTNDYINLRPPCNTIKVGSNLDSKGYGIGTVLGSDLRDRITLAVLELSEGEELTKLEKKWWNGNDSCPSDGSLKKHETTSSLKLPNVAGIFYILISGLSLALVMAALEFFYKSKVEAERRKTTFSSALRSKARLSIAGLAERHPATYQYTPNAQLISLDGNPESSTRTIQI